MERCRDELGGLEILVNSAGGGGFGTFLEQSPADVMRVIDNNLVSMLLCTQAAARIMVAAGTGGTIVNVASQAGRLPWIRGAVYGACKAGVTKTIVHRKANDRGVLPVEEFPARSRLARSTRPPVGRPTKTLVHANEGVWLPRAAARGTLTTSNSRPSRRRAMGWERPKPVRSSSRPRKTSLSRVGTPS
jgi:hypothetical protein